MQKKVKDSPLKIAEKRGLPIYSANPSVPSVDEVKSKKKVQIGDSQKGLIVENGTGEIFGQGAAVVYQWEEVDAERFIKLYLAGMKQAADLTKAGLAVLEMVYLQVQAAPGKDSVMLSPLTSGLAAATYYRGLRELLIKEFLYQSPFDGNFFINIRFMFNGDRLAFVKGYKRKSAAPAIEQADLFGQSEDS